MTLPGSCSEIIKEITTNLPDDGDQVIQYLQDHVRVYANHPCRKEVLYTLAEICTRVLSPKQFQEFARTEGYEEQFVRVLSEIVYTEVYEKRYDDAEHTLSFILPYAYSLDESDTFWSFRDFIEYAYYMTYVKPEQELPVRDYLGTEIVLYSGLIAAGRGDLPVARSIFSKVLQISPVNSFVLLQIADIQRQENNLEGFHETTLLCFRYAWKPDELAASYRNMGYYLTETGDYDAAVTCYLMSTTWEDSPITEQGLSDIMDKTGMEPDIPHYLKHGREILEAREIPFGPNPEIIDLMRDYADECLHEGDLIEARRYLTRAKFLQLSEELEQQIEKIERFIEDMTTF